jgi:hypothetical protein
VPQLVDLDHDGTLGRHRLGAMRLRVPAQPAHHALRRDADLLADRVHRQAGAVQRDRCPLHRGRLAARRGAGEPPAAILAPPTLSAAGMTRSDQRGSAACRASLRVLRHHHLHRSPLLMPFS